MGSGKDEFAQEEEGEATDHYSQTVSTILQHQSGSFCDTFSNKDSSTTLLSGHSAFNNWSPSSQNLCIRGSVKSQSTLKYILFTVSILHSKSGHFDETSPIPVKCQQEAIPDSVSGRLRKNAPQEELSANHVMAERRRREKLNERFIILRSLVPFITKMDKASILGDTIEYVKQLRERIQEFEARESQREEDYNHQRSKINVGDPKKRYVVKDQTSAGRLRKMRIVEESGDDGERRPKALGMVREGGVVAGNQVEVEVSIIESDALVELQCQHREGLLLDVMQVLRDLRVEITAVQSSVNDGIFVAELRAKVKEKFKGKRATIMEVKRAIHKIIPITTNHKTLA